MPSQYATEFTPELSQGYLANLLNQTSEQEQEAIANSRREGVAGGDVGQAAMGSRIGAATDAYNKNTNAAIQGFNMDVAGKQYSERMTDEAQAFQDTERQKGEMFQNSMAEMGYAFESSQQDKSLKAAKDAMPWGVAGGVASAAAGGYAGTL